MTFGSVMNNELRIEMVILYFLFYSTETGSAVIKFFWNFTGCFNVPERSHKLFLCDLTRM